MKAGLGSDSAPVLRDSEYRTLFDGTEKPTDVFRKWKMAGEGNFKIEGRALVAQPASEIGLLYYAAEQFDNFTLRLDFCLPHPRGIDNDNSGVFVRFRDPTKPVLPRTPRSEPFSNQAAVAVDTGYEVQIDEEARGDSRKNEPDGLFFNRTGAIYKMKNRGSAPGQQNYTNNQRLSAGAWHTYEIRVTERTYEVFLNGTRATVFVANSTDPNEAFRGRKSSEDRASGFIGLQAHTGNVAFANIRVKA